MNIIVHQPTGLLITEDGRVFQEMKYHDRGNSKIKYKHISHKGEKLDVHRLVAQCYLPNPENKPCVCHKDDNPQNNHKDNLFWGTHQENMEDARNKGKFGGFKNKRRKHIIDRDRRLIMDARAGVGSRELATKYKITESRISQILRKSGAYDKN